MAHYLNGEHDSSNTETFIRHDRNGKLLKIGSMATVEAHNEVPWFRGEVQEIHDDFVTIGYDNDTDGAISWDCSFDEVELDEDDE